MYKAINTQIPQPKKDCGLPVLLTDETIKERKSKILKRMKDNHVDTLIIYDDVEHGNNFAYLTGYYTRFEEGILVLKNTGEAYLILGNETLGKAKKARIENTPIHASVLSLPNQPQLSQKAFIDSLKIVGLEEAKHIGIVGWKLFTNELDQDMFDIPYFIMQSIKEIVGQDCLITNETAIFIGENGARTTNNANEVAHYEYGASLASDAILDAMNGLEIGKTELEMGEYLNKFGQHPSLTIIAATGERFEHGNMFPTQKKVKLGDAISLTTGYAGGSSSRAGYAANNENDLPDSAKNYINDLVAPYFIAYTTWLEKIHIGMEGKEMFNKIETVLPRSKYHWSFCPGHLTAEEEWMSSPIYEGSKETLKSGMIFQIDIIPSKNGMAGTGCESTVLLANEKLKKDIQNQYPEMWDRMMKRLDYMKNVLNIPVSDDILPMCSTVAYLRPFILNKDFAMKLEK